MKPIGERLGVIHCRNQGLMEGTQEYNDAMASYQYNFNDEAYGLSMTPSGLITQNPTVERISPHYFDMMTRLFGPEGFMTKNIKDEKEVEKKERTVRDFIAIMSNFILSTKYGLTVDGPNSVFLFKKGAKKEENNKTIAYRYLRLFYAVKLEKALESVLIDLDPKGEIGLDINKKITSILGSDDWQKDSTKSLNSPKTRNLFVENLYNEGKAKDKVAEQKDNKTEVNEMDFKKLKLAANPSKNEIIDSDLIFSHDSGLYFNKYKLDSYVEENRDKVRLVKPKKQYMQNPVKVSSQEINKADLVEPIVFGTKIVGFEKKHFLITGQAQILRAIKEGFPSLDCIVISPQETLHLVVKTLKTKDKIEEMKKEMMKQK